MIEKACARIHGFPPFHDGIRNFLPQKQIARDGMRFLQLLEHDGERLVHEALPEVAKDLVPTYVDVDAVLEVRVDAAAGLVNPS